MIMIEYNKVDAGSGVDNLSSKVLKRQMLEKSARAISLEEPSFPNFDTRFFFIKIDSSHIKLMIENEWPLFKS